MRVAGNEAAAVEQQQSGKSIASRTLNEIQRKQNLHFFYFSWKIKTKKILRNQNKSYKENERKTNKNIKKVYKITTNKRQIFIQKNQIQTQKVKY